MSSARAIALRSTIALQMPRRILRHPELSAWAPVERSGGAYACRVLRLGRLIATATAETAAG